MPRLTYAENPVHPVVNDFPAALVPASLVFDMLHLVTRRGSFKVAAFFTLLMALLTGGAAATTGLADYREIPEGTEAKRMANAHGLLNAGVLGAVALQVLLRFTGKVGFFARVLNIASTLCLAASSWYGTQLVYRQGVRVRDAHQATAAPDASPGRGQAVAGTLDSLLRRVPATDLSVYAAWAGRAATSATQGAQEAIQSAGGEIVSRAEEIRATVRGSAHDADHEAESHGPADFPSFDDQGALSGAIPEQQPVDVAAAVRASLPDDGQAG